MTRFLSDGRYVGDFSDRILVACPKCGKRTKIVNLDGEMRLSCLKCGHARKMGQVYAPDAMYGVGLFSRAHLSPNVMWDLHCWDDVKRWLVTPCCGEELWANNLEHLLYLKAFVAADLRERRRTDDQGRWHNRAITSRLPRWMTDRRNRQQVLAAIAKLERMAKD